MSIIGILFIILVWVGLHVVTCIYAIYKGLVIKEEIKKFKLQWMRWLYAKRAYKIVLVDINEIDEEKFENIKQKSKGRVFGCIEFLLREAKYDTYVLPPKEFIDLISNTRKPYLRVKKYIEYWDSRVVHIPQGRISTTVSTTRNGGVYIQDREVNDECKIVFKTRFLPYTSLNLMNNQELLKYLYTAPRADLGKNLHPAIRDLEEPLRLEIKVQYKKILVSLYHCTIDSAILKQLLSSQEKYSDDPYIALITLADILSKSTKLGKLIKKNTSTLRGIAITLRKKWGSGNCAKGGWYMRRKVLNNS